MFSALKMLAWVLYRVLITRDATGFQRNADWLSTLHATESINQTSQPIRRVCGRALPGNALLAQRKEYVYNLIHKYETFLTVAAAAKKSTFGGANKLKVRAIWSKLLDPFFFIRTIRA